MKEYVKASEILKILNIPSPIFYGRRLHKKIKSIRKRKHRLYSVEDAKRWHTRVPTEIPHSSQRIYEAAHAYCKAYDTLREILAP